MEWTGVFGLASLPMTGVLLWLLLPRLLRWWALRRNPIPAGIQRILPLVPISPSSPGGFDTLELNPPDIQTTTVGSFPRCSEPGSPTTTPTTTTFRRVSVSGTRIPSPSR